jgi:hypothetical protein
MTRKTHDFAAIIEHARKLAAEVLEHATPARIKRAERDLRGTHGLSPRTRKPSK